MYINKVISFRDSWNYVNSNYSNQLNEILEAIGLLIYSHKDEESGRMNPREIWDRHLYERGWELIERTHYTPDGKRINLTRLGPIKNGLSALLSHSFNLIKRASFEVRFFYQAGQALKCFSNSCAQINLTESPA